MLRDRTQTESATWPPTSDRPACFGAGRAEREGRPSGESWRCRGKMPEGRGGQQSAGCRTTCGRGAKRTQILAIGCSTPELTLYLMYASLLTPVASRNLML